MKLLIVPWGRNLGHIMRCLSVVAEAAKQSDMQAMIALPQRWRETVERLEVRLLSYPEELTAMPAWENWQQLAHLHRSLQADLDLLQRAQPDVVLHDIRPTMLIACSCWVFRASRLANVTNIQAFYSLARNWQSRSGATQRK